MAATIEASNKNGLENVTSLPVNVPVTAGNMVVVKGGVSASGAVTVTGVTVGGAAATLRQAVVESGEFNGGIWTHPVSPGAGSVECVMTFSGNGARTAILADSVVGAGAIRDADVSAFVDDPSVILATVAGDLCIDLLFGSSDSTPGASQTLIDTEVVAGDFFYSSQETAAGADTTMSWDVPNPSAILGAIAIASSGGGSTASDDFQGLSAGQWLTDSADWAPNDGGGGSGYLRIVDSAGDKRVQPYANGPIPGARWVGDDFGDAHFSEIVSEGSTDSGCYIGPAVRMADDDTPTYYRWVADSDESLVQRVVAGVPSLIYDLGPFLAGEKIALTHDGVTLRGYRDEVLEFAAADTVITGGRAGIAGVEFQDSFVDEWRGGGLDYLAYDTAITGSGVAILGNLTVAGVGVHGTTPLPPTNLVATDIQQYQVTVVFDDENGGNYEHRAYYRQGGIGSWLSAGDLEAGFTEFTFVGLEAGTEYEFAFSAFNDDDESALSGTITEFTLAASDVNGSGIAVLGNLTASGTGTVEDFGPIEGSGVAVLGSLEAFGYASIPVDAALEINGIAVPVLQGGARRKFNDLAPTMRMADGTLRSGRTSVQRQFQTWDIETTLMDRTDAIALETAMRAGNVPAAGVFVGGGTVQVFVPPSSIRRREHETLAYASLSFVMEAVG